MEWYHVFWALHGVTAFGALALAVFARRQALGFAATTWILAGLALPFFYGKGVALSLVTLAVALGPLTAPFWLASLAIQFPLITAPILVFAAYVSWLVLSGLDLLRLTSLSALVGETLFALMTWASAEAGVGLLIRARAAAQAEGAYCLDQLTVVQMLREAMRDDRRPHATLVDGETTYMWSFSELRFVPQTNDLFVVYGGERRCLSKSRA